MASPECLPAPRWKDRSFLQYRNAIRSGGTRTEWSTRRHDLAALERARFHAGRAWYNLATEAQIRLVTHHETRSALRGKQRHVIGPADGRNAMHILLSAA